MTTDAAGEGEAYVGVAGAPGQAPTGKPTASDLRVIGAAVLVSAVAGVSHYAGLNEILTFVVSGLALALLASVVGRSVDALGDRLGAGATGVVHAALGNLPELFFGIFALRAGLDDVVLATVVGSVLSTTLLVLGAAFIVGGRKFGTQYFNAPRARAMIVSLLLAVVVIAIPTLTTSLKTPAAQHESALSVICAIVLLAVFLLGLPESIRRDSSPQGAEEAEELEELEPAWSLPLALGTLAGSSVLAALVSDWFVDALRPATHSLGISEAFAGLVIVALAGNAVENVVGIRLAARGRTEYALSVTLNSPLQIVLLLFPALVLLSHVIGAPTPLTFALPPLLLAELLLATIVTAFVVYDGESTWLEGTALSGLYVASAAAFWWG